MSETHLNAYALELQEKRQQRNALDGEIARLEAIVEPPKKVEPEEVAKEIEELEPKSSDSKKGKKS